VPEHDERLTAVLRLAVAVGALAVYALDPNEHPGRRTATLVVLGLFAAYGAVSYVRTVRGARRLRLAVAPWLDVAWITLALGVSQGTSEIFYPLYVFAILGASFRGGFGRGLAVAVVSAITVSFVGAMTAPPEADFRLFLLRPAYLLVLGVALAVWGGHEVRSRARLALLRDVAALSSGRSGFDVAVARVLEGVRAFFRADSCRWVVADELSGERWMRAVHRGRPDVALTTLPQELAAALLPVPADAPLRAHAGLAGKVTVALDAAATAPSAGDPRTGAALLTALDAGAVVSVPFRYHPSAPGRLYVARGAGRVFDADDVELLRQVAEQVASALENQRLVDRLASDAANEERRRIALDLHDSVIQPYLGLRLGLSAASAALVAGRPLEAGTHLQRLLELADGEIQTLRGYVRGLRSADGTEAAPLEASLRRFCRRFTEATGIRVDLETSGAAVDDRIASEVFQLIAEALSNVRRHTTAARAEVRIESGAGHLRVVVSNDGAGAGAAAFFPRSLAERAAALGGHLTVQRPATGTTAVRVEVPLS
jgi:signal transduction histidine kinase